MDDYEEDAALTSAQKNGRAALFGFAVGHGQWFDVRVIYIRVTRCPLDDAADALAIRFPARSIGKSLEMNGGRISPSEEVSVSLRRDRVDTE